jgi:hypothetical protein
MIKKEGKKKLFLFVFENFFLVQKKVKQNLKKTVNLIISLMIFSFFLYKNMFKMYIIKVKELLFL